jgi:hypothetical protein
MNQLDQLRNLCRSALALSSVKIRKSFEILLSGKTQNAIKSCPEGL